MAFERGTFRVRGDIIDIYPAGNDSAVRVELFGDEIESIKEMNPVTGEILEVNTALEDAPELVNNDPYGEGWMIKIAVKDAAELDGLMDAEAYAAFIA